MKTNDMDECICSEWDKRGRSTCGIACPVHPPDGLCQECKQVKTHNSVDCFKCWARKVEAAKPPIIKDIEKADYHLVQTFQALERVMADAAKAGYSVKPAPEPWIRLIKDLRRERDWLLDRMSEIRERFEER
jgi:hypothetical protein